MKLLAKITAALTLAAALAFTACDGGGGSGTEAASSVFVSKTTIPPGVECANGGIQIDMGFDENQNNVLDADEIRSTEYVCNGTDGEDGTDYNPGTAVTGVSLDVTTTSIVVGATQQLTATVTPGDATNMNVSWLSTDESVATVSATGLVTAVNAGTAAIVAITRDGVYTDTCLVTVTESLYIGMTYQGGVIAYIYQSGDPGYVPGETHGIIAAASDQSTGIIWAVSAFQSTAISGGTRTALGTGAANTEKIISQNGEGTTYAAGLARSYNGGGYTDWYLPSKDEMYKLYINRVAVGGFAGEAYWSSSELGADQAWAENFSIYGVKYLKSGNKNVRAVRSF